MDKDFLEELNNLFKIFGHEIIHYEIRYDVAFYTPITKVKAVIVDVDLLDIAGLKRIINFNKFSFIDGDGI